jgi:hypothetical protein
MVSNLGNTLFLCVLGQRLFENWSDLFISGTDFGFRGVRMFLLKFGLQLPDIFWGYCQGLLINREKSNVFRGTSYSSLMFFLRTRLWIMSASTMLCC